jgi:hypothetical protein
MHLPCMVDYLIKFKNQFYSSIADSTTGVVQGGKKKLNSNIKKNYVSLKKDLGTNIRNVQTILYLHRGSCRESTI